MNKIIKIILMFIGVFALLFGIILLSDELSKGTGIHKRKVSKFQELSETFPKEWHAEGQWNRKLFDSQYKLVDKFKINGKLLEEERYKLLELVGMTVDDIVDSLFNVEMANPESDENKVLANEKGLVFLRSFEDGRTKTKPYAKAVYIEDHIKMYQAYANALSFARNDFPVSVSVTDDFTWRTFDSIRSEWDRDRDQIENGRYFSSHFSRINVVRRGWNDYTSKVDRAKGVYYDELEKNLKSKVDRRYKDLKESGNELIRHKNSIDDTDGAALSGLWDDEREWRDSVDTYVKQTVTAQYCAQTRLRNQAGSNSTIYTNLCSSVFNRIPSDTEEWKENVKNALHP